MIERPVKKYSRNPENRQAGGEKMGKDRIDDENGS
jgi:hypothetical protein